LHARLTNEQTVFSSRVAQTYGTRHRTASFPATCAVHRLDPDTNGFPALQPAAMTTWMLCSVTLIIVVEMVGKVCVEKEVQASNQPTIDRL
jgi:hypothetical protein